MWPLFLPLTVLDGVIGSALPPAGDGWNLAGALVFAAFANLVAIVVLAAPLQLGLRRARHDLPKVVAGDYAGRAMMGAFTTALLVAGLVHHANVQSDRRAMADAIKRAQAFIGTRASPDFQGNVAHISTFTIEDGSVYRMCVPNIERSHLYCVVVHERQPFAQSVRPDGSESNATLDAGVN
jgi:hypothetical protein